MTAVWVLVMTLCGIPGVESSYREELVTGYTYPTLDDCQLEKESLGEETAVCVNAQVRRKEDKMKAKQLSPDEVRQRDARYQLERSNNLRALGYSSMQAWVTQDCREVLEELKRRTGKTKGQLLGIALTEHLKKLNDSHK